MPLTFSSTAAGTSSDYIRYLYGKVDKTDKMGQPTALEFTLVPIDGSFVRLRRGYYIKFDTVTYPNWFTGFVTNEPELEYLGTKNGSPVWGYKYKAQSDEYLLNMKPIGLVPPFINMTMGQILTYLANYLCPGFYNTSGIQAGATLSRYVPDPQHNFSDVVNEFCDKAQYKFRANNKALTFKAQDSGGIGITVDGNSKHFTPERLSITPATDPIINEAVVMGDVEPQYYLNEYWYGDGLTAQYPMLYSVFGVDRNVLLDEIFDSGAIDTSKWTESDDANNWIQVSNGYLNFIGGNFDQAFNRYLASAYLIPLEGSLKVTHGEWDFVNTGTNNRVQGVIAGLWTGTPARVSDTSYTGCVFGIRCQRDSGGNVKLNPVTNGAVDTGTTLTVDTTKRYIIRTLYSADVAKRYSPPSYYINSSGVVSSYSGTALGTTFSFTTTFTPIDPATGTAGTATTWTSSTTLTSEQLYAYYVPGVTDDLHCTVSGITISKPMEVFLEQKPSGGSFSTKIIGPNEIDSFDGLTPVATIVDANNGSATRSSLLGSPQINSGNAILTYFKDSTKQVSYLPAVGELVHLRYRSAGASVARVRDNTSIDTEATLWGDNGVRSSVRTDLDPLPRTSADCEVVAAAIVGDNSYAHYQGSYEQYSPYFTTEPLSGGILPFANLPSGMPSVTAEEVNTVKTSFESSKPSELFKHTLSFGKRDLLTRFLTKYTEDTDIFAPKDTTEVPKYIQPSSVGLAFASDITGAKFSSMTSSQITLDTGQSAPSGGGFEVRYTDESWGCDDSKNLITRTSSQTFTVPRKRNTVAYIKAYDKRNLLKYSEDMTQAIWTKANGVPAPTVANANQTDPDGNNSVISSVTFAASSTAEIYQIVPQSSASTRFAYTVSLKGTAGQQVKLLLQAQSAPFTTFTTTVTFTGNWQRVSVTGLFGSGDTGNIAAIVINNADSLAKTFQMTRASLESGTSSETVYCKTNASTYGALSRYPAVVRCNFPLVPSAPTSATIDYTDYINPKITVGFPAVRQDIWGIEVRASDNSTVLYKKDLVDAEFNPVVTVTGNNSLSLSYYIYFYNVLGEYSSGYNATATISRPLEKVTNGKNSVYNPSFEINTTSTVHNASTWYTTEDIYFCDDWKNGNTTTNVCWRWHLDSPSYSGDTAAAYSGNYSFRAELKPSLAIPNGTSNSEFRVKSNYIKVTPGNTVTVAARMRWDANTAFPAGVSAIQRVGIIFKQADGTDISEHVADLNGGVGWTLKAKAAIVPSNAAYAEIELAAFVSNSSGSTFNTTTLVYAQLRWDDIYFTQQSSTLEQSGVNTANTPSPNPLSQSGTSTTINVSSFSIYYGFGTVSYNSGSIPGLAYSTKYYVYTDDPSFSGGPATYAVTTNSRDLTNAEGRIYLGSITLSAGGGGIGGGGGSGACLIAGTPIRLADGTDKPVEELTVGDVLLSPYDEPCEFMSMDEITDAQLYRITLSDGRSITCSGTHHLLVNGLWLRVQDIYWPNAKIWCEGEEVGLTATCEVLGTGTIYRLHLTSPHIYLGGGIWSHNMIDPSNK